MEAFEILSDIETVDIEAITDPVVLHDAWAHVLERDAADGTSSRQVKRFAAHAESNLERLCDELTNGRYQPGPLHPVPIPKDDGDVRVLLLSEPRDRIVERALAELIVPAVDAALSEAAHAYRPGRGVGSAVREVAWLRDEGMSWVARTDIDDCFSSIPVSPVVKRVGGVVGGSAATLVATFLDPKRRPRPLRSDRGLPQGSSLSPMLSNLYLDPLDRNLMKEGFPVVRYADDIAIPADSETEAKEGLHAAEKTVTDLALRLGAEDSKVISFAEGFCFLGEDFNQRYPAGAPAGREPPGRAPQWRHRPGLRRAL